MAQKYGIWVAIILAAIAFGGAGAAKLAGVPMVHESFANLGLPSWFGYFIGVCEIAGAVGLLIRPLSALAALGLGIIMVGAVYYHFAYTPISEGIPAMVLLLFCIFIFMARRDAMLGRN